MSSIESEDRSCMDAADAMSCAAMTILAKKEAKSDASIRNYSLLYPACERMNSLKDRGLEYTLQANGIVSRNICFNPNVMIKTGEWDQQFEVLQPPHQQQPPPLYDYVTRPR